MRYAIVTLYIAVCALSAQQSAPPAGKSSPSAPRSKKAADAAEDVRRTREQLQQNIQETERFARAAGMNDFEFSIAKRVVGDQPETPLPFNALKAISLSKPWQEEAAEPVAGKDGRVLYIYGQGMPNLACRPGHFTTIEFQPGEKISSEEPYEIASTEVWKIDTTVTVADGIIQSYATLFARRVGYDTDLIINTDRRRYYLRLWSTDKGYVSRVAFRYPDYERERQIRDVENTKAAEEKRRADEMAADKERRDRQSALAEANTLKPPTATQYEWSVPKDAPWLRPASVTDDGQHVYVKLTPDIKGHDWPILYITGKAGRDMPNVHVDPDDLTFTVDGLFTKADLAVGPSGRRQTKVEIRRVR